MLKTLKWINDKLTWFLNWVVIILLALMVIFVVAQVFYRYVLLKPLSWSEELSGYVFSGVFFFGAVLLYRESRHINMSLLVDSIKNKFVRELVIVISHLFSFFFLLVLVWYSFPMSLQILEFEVVSPSMEWLKMGYVFMIVPVASVLSLMVLLEVILNSLVRLKEFRS
jgi:TRAP-type C4-dicarboxylate transport system permease small subunit